VPQLFFVERQVEKIDPLLDWMESEFGFKPVVYSSFFGGKQEDGLLTAVETLLKKTDDCELAAIDAIAGAAHSLTVALGLFHGKLQIEEAIELIRLEEDFQVPIVFYLSITHRYVVSLDIHLNQFVTT
jgi:ATP synthase F1 complex assembly factor 2